MKANEAPEKIWIAVYGNDLSYEWHSDSEFGAKDHNDIEYTRTDAFIEKAINFFEMLGYGFTITDNITHTNYDKEYLVEDFKEYLKK